ncbi:hypothetical protein D3C80_2241510 [compost metagenome]
MRFARRLARPFMPNELAGHLQMSERQTRHLLHQLVEQGSLVVSSGNQRYRSYALRQ